MATSSTGGTGATPLASPIRKSSKYLDLKTPPRVQTKADDVVTVVTMQNTKFPPGSEHGEPGTDSQNLAIGVRLRRGIMQAKEKVHAAFASARLNENISWDGDKLFNFVKVISSEQVDNMLVKIRAIPGVGTITFTDDYVTKYAELKGRAKPVILLAVEPNLMRVTGRTFPIKNYLKQEGFTNSGGAEHLYTSLTQDEAELAAKHIDLQELCDFWGFVLRSA